MFDAIVVGVGSMGSAACYEMSRRGLKVLGIEQFDIAHELGSHGGQSRLIRKAYFEHPDYVPLLIEAYKGWSELELLAKRQLYWETGIIYFGPSDNGIIEGVKYASSIHNIDLEKIEIQEAMLRWPQFSVPKKFECLFEPKAGFLSPENAILSFVNIAQQHGCLINTNERVESIKENNGIVEVVTSKDVYVAKKVILTAGPYTDQLIEMPVRLKVTSQLLAWTKPIDNSIVELGNMPCWMVAEEERPGLFYGFPQLDNSFEGPSGLKIAYHRPGKVMDNPMIEEFDSTGERAILSEVLNNYLPNLKGEISLFKQCRYTYTPDEHFILDFHPNFNGNVLIAAGFSGHGFKFVPVIGKAISDMAITGKTELPVGFLKLDRFG